MPAGEGNLRGHFENLDFVEFHMHELRRRGLQDAGWCADVGPLDEHARDTATALLLKNARPTAWGWKDPRTTLFLGFWDSLIEDARYVLLYREPADVIASLYRRRDPDIMQVPTLAPTAWLAHNNALLKFARQNRDRCVLANVTAITTGPERFLQLLCDRFSLDLHVEVASPFDSDLMKEASKPMHEVLRVLYPDVAALYADLEVEAELPSGAAWVKPVSTDEARAALCNAWIAGIGNAMVPPAPLGETNPPRLPRDVADAIATLQSAFREHQQIIADLESIVSL